LVFSCPAAGRELATEPQEAGHEKLLEGILYLHFDRYSLTVGQHVPGPKEPKVLRDKVSWDVLCEVAGHYG